jgi:hypothetical protein
MYTWLQVCTDAWGVSSLQLENSRGLAHPARRTRRVRPAAARSGRDPAVHQQPASRLLGDLSLHLVWSSSAFSARSASSAARRRRSCIFSWSRRWRLRRRPRSCRRKRRSSCRGKCRSYSSKCAGTSQWRACTSSGLHQPSRRGLHLQLRDDADRSSPRGQRLLRENHLISSLTWQFQCTRTSRRYE